MNLARHVQAMCLLGAIKGAAVVPLVAYLNAETKAKTRINDVVFDHLDEMFDQTIEDAKAPFRAR